jgi:hypothetical protein
MPCKKHKRKTRKRRQSSYSMNQPMRVIGDSTKAVVGIATLGIVANTATSLLKK